METVTNCICVESTKQLKDMILCEDNVMQNTVIVL